MNTITFGTKSRKIYKLKEFTKSDSHLSTAKSSNKRHAMDKKHKVAAKPVNPNTLPSLSTINGGTTTASSNGGVTVTKERKEPQASRQVHKHGNRARTNATANVGNNAKGHANDTVNNNNNLKADAAEGNNNKEMKNNSINNVTISANGSEKKDKKATDTISARSSINSSTKKSTTSANGTTAVAAPNKIATFTANTMNATTTISTIPSITITAAAPTITKVPIKTTTPTIATMPTIAMAAMIPKATLAPPSVFSPSPNVVAVGTLTKKEHKHKDGKAAISDAKKTVAAAAAVAAAATTTVANIAALDHPHPHHHHHHHHNAHHHVNAKALYLRTKNEEAISDLRQRIPEIENIFDVHTRIGNGTFSTVLLGTLKKERDLPDSMRRKFAIKHHVPTSHPDRIMKELQCMAKIGGTDNVVGINCCIRYNESVAFIMPYMQHDRFHDFFCKMDIFEVQAYMKNLLIALKRVHKFNVIHRDVKPSNFLYNRRKRQFLLVDFGLAQQVPTPQLTSPFGSTQASIGQNIFLRLPHLGPSDNANKRGRDLNDMCFVDRNVTAIDYAHPKRLRYDERVGGAGGCRHGHGHKHDRICTGCGCPNCLNNIEDIETKLSNQNNSFSVPTSFKMPLKQLNEITAPGRSLSHAMNTSATANMSIYEPGRQVKTTIIGGSNCHRLQQRFMNEQTNATAAACNAAVASGSHVHPLTTAIWASAQNVTTTTSASGTINTTVNTTIHANVVAALAGGSSGIGGGGGGIGGGAASSAGVGGGGGSVVGGGGGGVPGGGGGGLIPGGVTVNSVAPTKYNANRQLNSPSKCFCYGNPQVCNICLIKKEIHASRAGTPGYRPPEVLLKYPDQTTAVDIWAAGVIFLSILSSVYPFFKAPNDYVALAEMVTIFGDKTIRKTAFHLDRLVSLSQRTKPLDLRKLCVRFRNRAKFSSPDLLKKYQRSDGSCEVCKNCDQFFFNCLCIETNYNTEPVADDDAFPDSAYDLLNQLLEVNPHKRITAEEALKHPFFEELPKPSRFTADSQQPAAATSIMPPAANANKNVRE